MTHRRVLELIWQGDIRPATGPGARRIQRALGALLPLHTVSLVAGYGIDRSLVLSDETELLPELPLSDVLAEELSIDMPAGSLVVIGNADLLSEHTPDDAFSYELGMLVAEALLGVIRSGVFPLARETNALYAMASSYYGLIERSGFIHLGLVPGQFRAGLAAGLCAYWAGARTVLDDTSDLSLQPDFLTCPRLLSYLRQLDSNFTAPNRIPAGLMMFSGGPCTYGAWLFKVWNAVSAKLDAHTMRICDCGKKKEEPVQASRKN